MHLQKTKKPANADNEVNLTHVFDAPRELVFAAWTDPQQLISWFAPRQSTITYKHIDVRTGGKYHSCVHDPVYGECWCKGTYVEVTFPERIIFSMEITDSEGNNADMATSEKTEEWPAKTIVTVTFTELNGKTHLSLHQTVSASLAQQTGALPSWVNMLQKLDTMTALKNTAAL